MTGSIGTRCVGRCIVINLDSRPDKWASASDQCRRVGLRPERFSALDPDEALQRFGEVGLRGGNLGLNASFDAILEMIATDDDDAPWTLILEDDVRFLRSFSIQRITDLLNQADERTLAVRLGRLSGNEWRVDKSMIENLHRFVRPRARAKTALARISREPKDGLVRSHAFQAGTHAVAVRRSTVEQLRAALNPYEQPLDHLFYRAMQSLPSGYLYDSRRNLASQRSVASDIASTRDR
jgi:hypothetical protein